MACWKVGIEAFWRVGCVKEESWASAQVAMAAAGAVKRRRGWRKTGLGLKVKKKERWGLWGLRIEVTKQREDRIAIAPPPSKPLYLSMAST